MNRRGRPVAEEILRMACRLGPTDDLEPAGSLADSRRAGGGVGPGAADHRAGQHGPGRPPGLGAIDRDRPRQRRRRARPARKRRAGRRRTRRSWPSTRAAGSSRVATARPRCGRTSGRSRQRRSSGSGTSPRRDPDPIRARGPARADQGRLQPGRMPRHARGQERLPSQPARLRPGPRLRDPGARTARGAPTRSSPTPA